MGVGVKSHSCTNALLMARSFGIGLALACVAALAYLPFSQRTLVRRAYRVTGDHRFEA